MAVVTSFRRTYDFRSGKFTATLAWAASPMTTYSLGHFNCPDAGASSQIENSGDIAWDGRAEELPVQLQPMDVVVLPGLVWNCLLVSTQVPDLGDSVPSRHLAISR